MSWFYRHIARPVLFNYDSEEIHNRTLQYLGKLSRNRLGLDMLESFYGQAELPKRLFGLDFPNPVGLAAGMDKKAEAVPAWAAFGFGFSELGGVTAHAQPGNPQPRMFRAIEDEALINRMGFNNPGAEAVAERLKYWKKSGFWPKHPVGINLGKSKVTPLEEAARDYATSFRLLREYADFFVVNVSSPNTPNLRQLQDKDALFEIFKALNAENTGPEPRPILVKIAPDLTFEAIDEILDLVEPCKIAGIVATNTTIARPEAASPPLAKVYSEKGGLSGGPLGARSTEVIRLDERTASDNAAGVQHGIASDVRVVAEQRAKLAQAGVERNAVLLDGHILRRQLHIGNLHPGAEMRLVAEDGVAHVREVRHLRVIKKKHILELA